MPQRVLPSLVLLACLAVCASAEDGKKQEGKKGGPKVGEAAPNFKATVLGNDEEVELAEVLKKERKPVVLIFGSST